MIARMRRHGHLNYFTDFLSNLRPQWMAAPIRLEPFHAVLSVISLHLICLPQSKESFSEDTQNIPETSKEH